jgi:hypothetical protein
MIPNQGPPMADNHLMGWDGPVAVLGIAEFLGYDNMNT